MATWTKWFRDLPLKEVRKVDGSVHLGSPIIWVASSPAALEANGRVLLDPRGGEWLKDPHRPETLEVGLERTQQVWVVESWWLGWEEERKPSQLEALHRDPPGAESYCQCSFEMGRGEAISFFFFLPLTIPLKGGFPDGSELRILLPVQEAWVQSLGWEVPLRRKWLPTSVFLPSNAMDWGAWGLQPMGSYRVRYDWVCRHCNLIHLDGKWWSWCCGHKLFTSLGLPFPNFNYVVLEELLKHT